MFRNSQGQEDFLPHQWSKWRVNIKERKKNASFLRYFLWSRCKKKSHWKEKLSPGEEKSCVLSAENTTVSTYCSQEEKKWNGNGVTIRQLDLMFCEAHTQPYQLPKQAKKEKKEDIITCPSLWPQRCVSHLRESTLLFCTTPTASVTEEKAERIGVTHGTEICLSHNAYCEGTFVAYGDIIPKKSQAAGRGATR